MSSSFHINIFMITAEQAMQELFYVARERQYLNAASHSVEREFVDSYPVPAKPPFVADGLPRRIGSARRIWTADSLRMKEVFYQLNYSTI